MKCSSCRRKKEKDTERQKKEEDRRLASICINIRDGRECGNPKLPESQRCRTCGAAMAGAAKLAKLALTRDENPPPEKPDRDSHIPKTTRLVRARGHRLYCILCPNERWVEQLPAGRIRCACGGSVLSEPEDRKVWK